MKTEHGKIEGNIRVEGNLDLYGMVTGNAFVAPGGALELHGMVCQDLILAEGSVVNLYGTVSASVYNRGGDLHVYGSIGGSLHRQDGNTVIDPDAVIKGSIL